MSADQINYVADHLMVTASLVALASFVLGWFFRLGVSWCEAHAERVADRIDAEKFARYVDRAREGGL